jgi:hypothetical protein
MRCEAEAAARLDGVEDLGGVQAAVVDRPLEPEREEVVLTLGGHLLADQDQHGPGAGVVPPFLAALAGGEGVVVGQEYEVEPICRPGARDFPNGAGPVRIE